MTWRETNLSCPICRKISEKIFPHIDYLTGKSKINMIIKKTYPTILSFSSIIYNYNNNNNNHTNNNDIIPYNIPEIPNPSSYY
jgi:hypothetical protein